MHKPLVGWSCLALACACAFASTPVQAMSLGQAFEAALTYDPQYRAAGFELDASRLGVPIARASLLPAVSLSVSSADVTGRREFPNGLNQEVTTRVDYSSPQSTLALRAPVFNYEALSRYRQAQAQTEASEATFRARGLELMDRVGTAYIQALLARTALELSQTEVVSLQAQLARSEQRQLRGEGTRTEEAQARAALELARYRVIDGRDQLELTYIRLRRMTGQEPTWMQEIPRDYQPDAIAPRQLQDWLDLAVDQNPALQARRQAVAVARANVQRNFAGHLPRLDVVASLSRSQNESLANLNQSSKLASVGFQLSVPLFNGGGVDASVRQAEADQARTEQELRSERENLELEVQRLYLAVANGVARVDALKRVVAASEVAVLGMSRAMEAGLATNADVLDAQSKLFGSLRDLAQGRYEYLAGRLRLMAQAGMPMRRVVDDLNQILSVKTDVLRTGVPR